MMNEHDKPFMVGVLITSIMWMLVLGFLLQSGMLRPYDGCQEDEVWAWQQNEGDYPNNIKWSCIAVDNLLSQHNP